MSDVEWFTWNDDGQWFVRTAVESTVPFPDYASALKWWHSVKDSQRALRVYRAYSEIAEPA